jgi:FG-GAP repeat
MTSITFRTVLLTLVLGASALGQEFERERLFAPDDWAFEDRFGKQFALSGSWLVVGEEGDDDPGQNQWNIGKVHVFRREGSTWVHDQQFEGSDSASSDQFGSVVAITGDTLFAGARSHDGVGSSSGAVYVFRYNGVNWKEVQKLVPSDNQQGDNFGAALAVDGPYLVVGAFGLDDSQQNGGGFYIYEDLGGTWTQVFKRTPLTTGLVGVSAAISGDVVCVGAPGGIAGQAFVYERQADGTWAYATTLMDFSPNSWDDFGRAVAIEGNLIVVGENAGYPASPPRVGSAFVWERVAGQWVLQQELQASNGTVYGPACCKSGDLFGWSVAIDGGRIFVGATNNRELGDQMGSAYQFERDGAGTWVEVQRFLPSQQSYSSFGSYVGATTGELLVDSIGAWGGDPFNGDIAGALYLYDLAFGAPYCSAQPNSTGSAAVISARGYGAAEAGDLTLRASQLPSGIFGMFLASRTQSFVAGPGGSQGDLCLGNPIARFATQVQGSGVDGVISIAVDTSSIPLAPPVEVLPGETWNFQAWYRDSNPGPTSNFSGGWTVTFE